MLAGLVRLTEWWAMTLLMVMVAVVTVGVFFRYVVAASLTWYDEFASYLLVWLSFYGAVAATARGRHIAFETLAERLGRRARAGAAVVAEAFSAIFYAILCWYGLVLVRTMGEETSVSLPWVRMAWVYSALPISGALMLLTSLARVARLVRTGMAPPAARPAPETAATSAE